jgi:hypothetical protein
MTEITGIDHIYISVTDMARSEAFYDRVSPTIARKDASVMTVGIGEESNASPGPLIGRARSRRSCETIVIG